MKVQLTIWDVVWIAVILLVIVLALTNKDDGELFPGLKSVQGRAGVK
jgi:hypothetical protein